MYVCIVCMLCYNGGEEGGLARQAGQARPWRCISVSVRLIPYIYSMGWLGSWDLRSATQRTMVVCFLLPPTMNKVMLGHTPMLGWAWAGMGRAVICLVLFNGRAQGCYYSEDASPQRSCIVLYYVNGRTYMMSKTRRGENNEHATSESSCQGRVPQISTWFGCSSSSTTPAGNQEESPAFLTQRFRDPIVD